MAIYLQPGSLKEPSSIYVGAGSVRSVSEVDIGVNNTVYKVWPSMTLVNSIWTEGNTYSIYYGYGGDATGSGTRTHDFEWNGSGWQGQRAWSCSSASYDLFIWFCVNLDLSDVDYIYIDYSGVSGNNTNNYAGISTSSMASTTSNNRYMPCQYDGTPIAADKVVWINSSGRLRFDVKSYTGTRYFALEEALTGQGTNYITLSMTIYAIGAYSGGTPDYDYAYTL